MTFSLLFSPLTWLFFMFFLFMLLNWHLVPLSYLAISPNSLFDPLFYYTLFTAGLSHKSFLHLCVNLFFLVTLTKLYLLQEPKAPLTFFIKIALISNCLHGLILSILILGSTYTLYIYGSSGIVCSLFSFLVCHDAKTSSRNFAFLKLLLLALVLFSLMDIFQGGVYTLSSWSHLVGLIIGKFLTYLPWQEE